MGSGAFPITRLEHSQDKDSSPEASTRVYWHNPCTPLYRPLLRSWQTWRSMQFPQTQLPLHVSYQGSFFQWPWGFASTSWECFGWSAKGRRQLPWKQPQLSKTQVYNSFDSSSSHAVLEEPPPPAEMRGSCSSESALYHLRTDCSNMLCWFYETDKCPLGQKV